tara:strand:- start:1899 stop:2201 length:303 start_codon:yes stop_codon:yes gene_type:complete
MNLDDYKDTERDGFLLEIQRIALEIETLIDRYGVREDVMSLMIIGLIDDVPDGHQLKAVYGFNLKSRDELEELVSFAQESYGPDEPDIDGLLDGLGISLN